MDWFATLLGWDEVLEADGLIEQYTVIYKIMSMLQRMTNQLAQ